jgi:hypothetical protein
MFSFILMGIEGSLLEPIFMPELALSPPPPRRDLAPILADAGDYIRDLDARIARYKRTTSAAPATFAHAICEMGRHQHLSLTNKQCRATAESRVDGVLASWLEAQPYLALDYGPNGEVVEPKPWRTH